MTHQKEPQRPTRAEAIRDAAEVYGAILADPQRREQLRRHRAEREASKRTKGGPTD